MNDSSQSNKSYFVEIRKSDLGNLRCLYFYLGTGSLVSRLYSSREVEGGAVKLWEEVVSLDSTQEVVVS